MCWGKDSTHRLYVPNDFGSRWRRVSLLLLAELRVALRTRTGVVAAFPEMHKFYGDQIDGRILVHDLLDQPNAVILI